MAWSGCWPGCWSGRRSGHCTHQCSGWGRRSDAGSVVETPAGGIESGAGIEGTFPGAEELHDCGDFRDRAQSPQRAFVYHRLNGFRCHLTKKVGFHGGGSDAVDTDFGVAKFAGQGFGEGDHTGFCGGIGGEAGGAGFARDRCHIDHAAKVAGLHERYHEAAHFKDGVQIDLDDPAPQGGVGCGDGGGAAGDACIVDEDVEVRADTGERSGDCGTVADIDNVSGYAVILAGRQVKDVDFGTAFQQISGDPLPDPPGTAGDKGCLSGEVVGDGHGGVPGLLA